MDARERKMDACYLGLAFFLLVGMLGFEIAHVARALARADRAEAALKAVVAGACGGVDPRQESF